MELYQGDCLRILPELGAGRFALAFIDLPYGLGLASWDRQISGLEAIALVRPLLLPGGSIYATATAHALGAVQKAMRPRRLITWCKPNLPLRKTLSEWEWSTEFILWETIGDPRLFNKPPGEASRDYWRIPVENGFLNPDRNDHPARKPISLLIRILEASTDPGDWILDPFMGSGTTGAACKATGRNFVGIERDPKYFAMARARIEGTQPTLFSAPMEQGALCLI